jgi:hypothetical protein
MKMNLAKRAAILERTMERFAGKAFKLGENDCVKLARFHLKAMGHKQLPSTGHYSTGLGAKRQLRKTGHENLESLFDALLTPIAPARAVIGDLVLFASEPDSPGADIGTVGISSGVGGKVLGWHPDEDLLVVMDISEIQTAWRT